MDVAIHKSFNALQLVPGDPQNIKLQKDFLKILLERHMSSWVLR